MANPTLQDLPRVDRVLARPALQNVAKGLGQTLVTNLVRNELASARRAILASARQGAPTEAEVEAAVLRHAAWLGESRTRRVINATGILLHTNLGRAPLSVPARLALEEAASGYASLEMDLATGKRGGRGAFAEIALATLTSAEAALAVNNCAAAVLLALATVARDKAVVVSRGELVEIGGSFRVPEILLQSGARLVEVGTTNRTHLADYERAFEENPDVAAVLRVHQGNFRMTGFVERPPLQDLVELAHSRGIPLIKDLGGGALVELSELGEAGVSRAFSGEPTAFACVRAGADLVCFSGDKALGGPQAGIIVGTRTLVEQARKHPLARALRLGRLPLVALEATLTSYLEGRVNELPILAAVARPLAEVEARAQSWLRSFLEAGLRAELVTTEVEMGGGALADRQLPSFGVALRAAVGPDALAASLRALRPAVLGRVLDDAVVLDARSVLPGDDGALVEAVLGALAEAAST